jgi:hypothetical protein
MSPNRRSARRAGLGGAPTIVGNSTRAALNDFEVLSPKRVLANMDEWRWLPDDLVDLYVTVNIPEFTLRIVKNGAEIHTEHVITGLPDKETPVFSENMKTIIFKPRWNVPESIGRGDTYFHPVLLLEGHDNGLEPVVVEGLVDRLAGSSGRVRHLQPLAQQPTGCGTTKSWISSPNRPPSGSRRWRRLCSGSSRWA